MAASMFTVHNESKPMSHMNHCGVVLEGYVPYLGNHAYGGNWHPHSVTFEEGGELYWASSVEGMVYSSTSHRRGEYVELFPGYTRGLIVKKDQIIAGQSSPRKKLEDAEFRDQRCGLWIVDRKASDGNGKGRRFYEFPERGELYDLCPLE
jgi:hypothetical protein